MLETGDSQISIKNLGSVFQFNQVGNVAETKWDKYLKGW